MIASTAAGEISPRLKASATRAALRVTPSFVVSASKRLSMVSGATPSSRAASLDVQPDAGSDALI